MCFLLLEKLMSHLEPRTQNKGSAYAVIMPKRKFYYREIKNQYAKEATPEKRARTIIAVSEM